MSQCTVLGCEKDTFTRDLCNSCYAKKRRSGELINWTGSLKRHKLLSYDLEEKTGICVICGPIDIYVRPGSGNRTCGNKKRQEVFQTTYRITSNQYQEYLARRNGECEICQKKTDKLVFDHDHVSGKFRGWLCHSCNVGLGWFRDDPSALRKAASYLLPEFA